MIALLALIFSLARASGIRTNLQLYGGFSSGSDNGASALNSSTALLLGFSCEGLLGQQATNGAVTQSANGLWPVKYLKAQLDAFGTYSAETPLEIASISNGSESGAEGVVWQVSLPQLCPFATSFPLRSCASEVKMPAGHALPFLTVTALHLEQPSNADAQHPLLYSLSFRAPLCATGFLPTRKRLEKKAQMMAKKNKKQQDAMARKGVTMEQLATVVVISIPTKIDVAIDAVRTSSVVAALPSSAGVGRIGIHSVISSLWRSLRSSAAVLSGEAAICLSSDMPARSFRSPSSMRTLPSCSANKTALIEAAFGGSLFLSALSSPSVLVGHAMKALGSELHHHYFFLSSPSPSSPSSPFSFNDDDEGDNNDELAGTTSAGIDVLQMLLGAANGLLQKALVQGMRHLRFRSFIKSGRRLVAVLFRRALAALPALISLSASQPSLSDFRSVSNATGDIHTLSVGLALLSLLSVPSAFDGISLGLGAAVLLPLLSLPLLLLVAVAASFVVARSVKGGAEKQQVLVAPAPLLPAALPAPVVPAPAAVLVTNSTKSAVSRFSGTADATAANNNGSKSRGATLRFAFPEGYSSAGANTSSSSHNQQQSQRQSDGNSWSSSSSSSSSSTAHDYQRLSKLAGGLASLLAKANAAAAATANTTTNGGGPYNASRQTKQVLYQTGATLAEEIEMRLKAQQQERARVKAAVSRRALAVVDAGVGAGAGAGGAGLGGQ